MKFLSLISLCLAPLAPTQAGEWRLHLAGLSDPDQYRRNKAQSTILKEVRTKLSAPELQGFMDDLFNVYTVAPSPEAKLRLISILKQSAPLYKESLGQAFLGAEMKSGNAEINGSNKSVIQLGRIVGQSPAEAAHLKKDDEIFSLAGNLFEGFAFEAFNTLRKQYAPGETVTLGVLRNKQILFVDLTFGSVPDKPAILPLKLLLFSNNTKVPAPVLSEKTPPKLSDLQIQNLKEQSKSATFLKKDSFFTRWFKRKITQL